MSADEQIVHAGKLVGESGSKAGARRVVDDRDVRPRVSFMERAPPGQRVGVQQLGLPLVLHCVSL